MESFLLLPDLQSENVFHNMLLSFTKESKSWFWKQDIELSKQEMKLFLLLPEFQHKIFFYKMFLIFTNESKTGFENRKWNYFSYFLSSNQKTSFINIFNFW